MLRRMCLAVACAVLSGCDRGGPAHGAGNAPVAFASSSTPLDPLPPDAGPAKRVIVLRAARMLDVVAGRMLEGGTVVVDGSTIVAAGDHVAAPDAATVVDLRDATLLPGLIDCHTHLLARMVDLDKDYATDLATKSHAFRALEGAANARATLRAGFTSVRDVENEGSGYADVDLRDAIDKDLVEGPRMMVATRGIAAVGAYRPFGVSSDLVDFPTGAQMVSGVDEARRAAREQLGHGADLLKLYADWDGPTLTVDEMRAIVEEAHKHGKKVAAHAIGAVGIRNAIQAGVDSIEHGGEVDRASLTLMKARGIFWVPTRAAFREFLGRTETPEQHAWLERFVAGGPAVIAIARELGVKIASGYDAATVDMHGHGAHEIIELVRLGLLPLEAIRAATVNAAELLGRADTVGALQGGRLADVIAVSGDPLADPGALERVGFVMKGGKVIVNALSRPTCP